MGSDQVSPARGDSTEVAAPGAAAPGAAAAPSGVLDSLGVLNPATWLRRPGPAGDAGRGGRRTTFDRFLDLGIYAALIALFIYFWQASPFFLAQQNLLNVGAAVAVNGVLAAGMTIA